MAAHHLAHELHRDPALDRLYERHAARIYRFALAMLGDAADAELVTRATFENAEAALARGARPARAGTWLIRIAHALCRKFRGYDESVVDELARCDDGVSTACPAFEPLIARELDGPLGEEERAALHAHLRACEGCRSTALAQRALRAAIRALRGLPLPPSLARGSGVARPG